MIRQDPIFIAGPPRTGTTMLAGLLNIHGVWVGRARTTNFPETNCDFGSENLDIKDLMKAKGMEASYKNWNTPFPPQVKHWYDLKDSVEVFIPDDTPWLVKTTWVLVFFSFWMEAYPKARWIFTKRSIEAIQDSMNRHPTMKRHPEKQKRGYIEALQARQNKVGRLATNSFVLDINKMVNKDEEEITSLFTFLKIPIKWEETLNWIKPEMMKQ